MNCRKLCACVVALVCLLATSIQIAAKDKQSLRAANPQHYKLEVLDTLGGSDATGTGINNKGDVVGGSLLPGDLTGHASLWSKGTVTDLGSLDGGSTSYTFTNPNERDEVSGYSNTPNPDPNGEDFCFIGDHLICLGFLWSHGVMKALPTLGGNNSLAYGVSNGGQVVGVAENTTQDPSCGAYNLEAKPVIWYRGSVQELPTISGDPDGFAYWINDSGQIVGSTGACNAQVPATSVHAVLWPNGPNSRVVDLGNLGSAIWNIAFYINNKGQVVGQSGVPGGTYFHAFLWTDGPSMQDLGTLPGDFYSWANNINSKGQAVGTSFAATRSRAFIWQNGVMTDLNTLIPPNSPLYLLEAFGINERGQISGFGLLANGELRAYRLTPCDANQPGRESCDASRSWFCLWPSFRPPVARVTSRVDGVNGSGNNDCSDRGRPARP
jgi:probable HAF family extracellular repeat protein